jgi:hypothetical protein
LQRVSFFPIKELGVPPNVSYQESIFVFLILGLEYNFLLFEVEQAHLPRYWDKLKCSLTNYAPGLGIVF